MWWSLAVAFATITIDPPPQVEVESALVVLKDEERPAAGATVRAWLHPGLPEEREIAIGVTDARGRVLWTPEVAGRVRIEAADQELGLLVVHPQPPTGPLALLLLMIAAGVGATARSFTRPT